MRMLPGQRSYSGIGPKKAVRAELVEALLFFPSEVLKRSRAVGFAALRVDRLRANGWMWVRSDREWCWSQPSEASGGCPRSPSLNIRKWLP